MKPICWKAYIFLFFYLNAPALNVYMLSWMLSRGETSSFTTITAGAAADDDGGGDGDNNNDTYVDVITFDS